MQTLSNAAARTIAGRMNDLVKAHDLKAHAERVTHLVQYYSVRDQDLVVKYIGLDWKARARAERHRQSEIETATPTAEAQRHGIMWQRTRWHHDGESKSTRFYVIGEDNARWLHDSLAPTSHQSAYSPTGLWYRGTPTMRHVRGNVWQVQSALMLDC